MKLQLKDTFEVVGYPCQYVVRKGEPQSAAFMKYMSPFFLYAYPDGGAAGKPCENSVEAHAYLLSVGSESPFEDVSE